MATNNGFAAVVGPEGGYSIFFFDKSAGIMLGDKLQIMWRDYLGESFLTAINTRNGRDIRICVEGWSMSRANAEAFLSAQGGRIRYLD